MFQEKHTPNVTKKHRTFGRCVLVDAYAMIQERGASLLATGVQRTLKAQSSPLLFNSPFFLLDRKLHFGDVVARVHVRWTLEMNLAEQLLRTDFRQ